MEEKLNKKNVNKSKTNEKTNSLKAKLMRMLTMLCMFLLIVTGLIIYITVNSQFTDNHKDVLYETSNSVSKEAELFFQKYITTAEQMAQDKNIQNFFQCTYYSVFS